VEGANHITECFALGSFNNFQTSNVQVGELELLGQREGIVNAFDLRELRAGLSG